MPTFAHTCVQTSTHTATLIHYWQGITRALPHILPPQRESCQSHEGAARRYMATSTVDIPSLAQCQDAGLIRVLGTSYLRGLPTMHGSCFCSSRVACSLYVIPAIPEPCQPARTKVAGIRAQHADNVSGQAKRRGSSAVICHSRSCKPPTSTSRARAVAGWRRPAYVSMLGYHGTKALS